MIHVWARERISEETADQWEIDLISPIPGLTRDGHVSEELVAKEMELFASFKDATGA